jgi:hypothetical protein
MGEGIIFAYGDHKLHRWQIPAVINNLEENGKNSG